MKFKSFLKFNSFSFARNFKNQPPRQDDGGALAVKIIYFNKINYENNFIF